MSGTFEFLILQGWWQILGAFIEATPKLFVTVLIIASVLVLTATGLFYKQRSCMSCVPGIVIYLCGEWIVIHWWFESTNVGTDEWFPFLLAYLCNGSPKDWVDYFLKITLTWVMHPWLCLLKSFSILSRLSCIVTLFVPIYLLNLKVFYRMWIFGSFLFHSEIFWLLCFWNPTIFSVLNISMNDDAGVMYS